jgi:hypothetical protein
VSLKISIKKLYIDETSEIIDLIKTCGYNWKKHFHYIKIEKGEFGLTNIYKGNKGDNHQILKNVVIEVREDMPLELRSAFNQIIDKYKIKYKKIK